MTVNPVPSDSGENKVHNSVDPNGTVSDIENVNTVVQAAGNADAVAEATSGTGTELHNAVTVTVSELKVAQGAEYERDRDRDPVDTVHTEDASHGQPMDYVDSDTDSIFNSGLCFGKTDAMGARRKKLSLRRRGRGRGIGGGEKDFLSKDEDFNPLSPSPSTSTILKPVDIWDDRVVRVDYLLEKLAHLQKLYKT